MTEGRSVFPTPRSITQRHAHMWKQLVSVLCVLTSPLVAHDFWLEPSSYRPSVDQRVDVQLVVGEHFVGDLVARKEERIVLFAAFDSVGTETRILGRDGKSPAGLWKPSSAGLHVLGYRSNATKIEIEAEKFEHYLVEEGLEHVIAERKSRGESASKGLEAYARCPKAIVVARGATEPGAKELGGFDRVLGLPLEIVPLANPTTLQKDAKFSVRVLFQGAPLANALVGLMPKSEPAREVRLRTDAQGRVEFTPVAGGVHLVRGVHMTRAADGAAHQWESQWASLTCELPLR